MAKDSLSPGQQSKKWWVSRPAIGAAALVIGLGVGYGISLGADPTRSAEYLSLQETHSQLQTDSAEFAADLEASLSEIDELSKELTALRKSEKQAVEKVTASEQKEAELAELRSELERREADVVAREEAVAAEEVTIPTNVAPTTTAERVAPSVTSFSNCTEARAAGAAPVYAGEPGYGSHLDRDGDGVGCE